MGMHAHLAPWALIRGTPTSRAPINQTYALRSCVLWATQQRGTLPARSEAKAKASYQGHQYPGIHIDRPALPPARARKTRAITLTCGLLRRSSVMCDSGVKRCGLFFLLPEERFDRSEVIMRFRDDSLRGRGGVGGMASEASASAGGGPTDK